MGKTEGCAADLGGQEQEEERRKENNLLFPARSDPRPAQSFHVYHSTNAVLLLTFLH